MNYQDSICFSCKFNDYENMREIRAAYKSAHLEPPSHVWCRVHDRPEDVRWTSCKYLDDER